MSEKKRFVILIYGSGETVAQLPEAERQTHMQHWDDWVSKLQADGTYVGGSPLLPVARTIRGKAAKVSDGFFVPESEHAIGGYILITAASLNEAVEIATGCPTFELDGTVEVREEMPV
jgi:hypothetical protein